MQVVIMFLILLVHCTESSFHFKNNACKTDFAYLTWFINDNCYYNPNVDLDAPGIISRYNYNLEIHKVVTDDNYILTMFRIPPSNPQNAQPVFLQHGTLTDSTCFLNLGKKSHALKLADLGYDVWLGNLRGTPFSSGHLNLTVQDSEYWHYNADTSMEFDLRQQLHYVAQETGQQGSIIYIGHSLGSILMFMYSSKYPEEAQSLLRGVVTLSPVWYSENLHSWAVVAPFVKLLKFFNIPKVFFYYKLYQKLLKTFCTLLPWICRFAAQLVIGKSVQFPSDYLLLLMGSVPIPTAVDLLVHFNQMYEGTNFRHFDYGKNKNLLNYGTIEPPNYDIRNIKLPIYLLYGENDLLVPPNCVNKLYETIGSTHKFKVKIPSDNSSYDFNHMDFLYSKYIEEFLYKELIPILGRLPPKKES